MPGLSRRRVVAWPVTSDFCNGETASRSSPGVFQTEGMVGREKLLPWGRGEERWSIKILLGTRQVRMQCLVSAHLQRTNRTPTPPQWSQNKHGLNRQKKIAWYSSIAIGRRKKNPFVPEEPHVSMQNSLSSATHTRPLYHAPTMPATGMSMPVV